MWSLIHDKGNQRWLWHAIDHKTGKVLTYAFERRKDVVFKKLKDLLEPFEIKHYYTDNWAAYSRYLDEAKHHIGKRNTQKIERKQVSSVLQEKLSVFQSWKRCTMLSLAYSSIGTNLVYPYKLLNQQVWNTTLNKLHMGLNNLSLG